MFTGGYNLSSYNNRFWITGDWNKALQAWVIRVLWCHTITHHMPHTELMHACWYSNGSSCFPSRTGRKLIQRSFRFLSRQRPEGQIWYQHCKHSLMIKWWYISHLILLSSAITGVSRCGCSSSLCQSRSYQQIHRRNSSKPGSTVTRQLLTCKELGSGWHSVRPTDLSLASSGNAFLSFLPIMTTHFLIKPLHFNEDCHLHVNPGSC